MAKKFGALADFRQTQVSEPQDDADQKESTAVKVQPALEAEKKGRGRPVGKRSNPDYEATTVLLRKQTKRKASRLLEDIDSKHDLSELIETLLAEWITGNP